MINRYSLSPIKEIWTEKSQYSRWLKVELALISTYEALGYAKEGTCIDATTNARIDVNQIHEFEKTTNHDVISFIQCATQNMGEESKWFHRGLTSSDVVDTGLSLALTKAGQYIIKECNDLIRMLRQKAIEHKHTLAIGRTHGVHAEPTSFGLKLLSFLAETERNRDRIELATQDIGHAKLSGAVGNYANISPEVELFALKLLNLKPCKISTQIVPRDYHAQFLHALCMCGTGIERIALEIRHLQKTEVSEAQEGFAPGQLGSSAMPHKKNPIMCERLTGMARMLRSYTMTGYEDIPLWHERDISHSCVERIVFPDSTMIIFYMINKTTELIKNLVVNSDNMLKNLNSDSIFSQRILLTLIDKGIKRDVAYKIVQDASKSGDFYTFLCDNKIVRTKITPRKLKILFDLKYYLKNIDKIYERFR